MKGTPGTVPLLITIGAKENGILPKLLGPRCELVFYADALDYYPQPQRTVERYVPKIIRMNEANGYKTVNPGSPAQLDGISVSRTDFAKGLLHESVLVTIHHGYAFVFIFAGLESSVINGAIASTKVKLSK